MQVGIIGAGTVAQAIARRASAAGHEILVGARRKDALSGVDIGAARGVTVSEAANCDLVVLAVRWLQVEEALAPYGDWKGRILVDATNPFVSFEPRQLADLGGKSASVMVAAYAPGARVVKAFNSARMVTFDKGPVQAGARRVLFVSGDDASANAQVRQLIESMGYAALELGDLETGGRIQQPGGALAGRDLLLAD